MQETQTTEGRSSSGNANSIKVQTYKYLQEFAGLDNLPRSKSPCLPQSYLAW